MARYLVKLGEQLFALVEDSHLLFLSDADLRLSERISRALSPGNEGTDLAVIAAPLQGLRERLLVNSSGSREVFNSFCSLKLAAARFLAEVSAAEPSDSGRRLKEFKEFNTTIVVEVLSVSYDGTISLKTSSAEASVMPGLRS